MNWTPEQEAAFKARRKHRNVVLGLVLAAFAVLFYLITVSRIHV